MLFYMNDSKPTLSGSCLCGSVQFEIEGPVRDVISCYCSECRKTSGNFVSATRVSEKQITYLQQSSLRWYKNDLAVRGFCQQCGANLFWKRNQDDDYVSVMAGCLQADNGLKVSAHIFVADKSDFHQINDAAPQYQKADQ